MKFLHLADLHLGKRVNGFSMLEDQAHILRQILAILDDERPDGVLIAGDVYDKSVPSVEAVELLDGFLTELRTRGVPVLLISGNHDSPERLAFGGRVMDSCGIHISPVYDGALAPVTLQDAFGPVHVWLLPFVKPAHVRRWFPDADIESYTDAMAEAVAHMDIDTAARNVLVTHQSSPAARAAARRSCPSAGRTMSTAASLRRLTMWRSATCTARSTSGARRSATLARRSNTRFPRQGSTNPSPS